MIEYLGNITVIGLKFLIYAWYLNSDSSQKSHDTASNKKYSNTAYSKQMSLDESNENDNLATSIKRYDKKDYKSWYKLFWK